MTIVTISSRKGIIPQSRKYCRLGTHCFYRNLIELKIKTRVLVPFSDHHKIINVVLYMDLHLVSFGLCDVDYYSYVAVSKSLRQAMREK